MKWPIMVYLWKIPYYKKYTLWTVCFLKKCVHVVNVATSYTNQCHTYLSISVSTPGVDAPPSPVVEVQPVVVNLAEGNFDF